MIKYVVAFATLIFVVSACGSDPVAERNKTVSEVKKSTYSTDKSSSGLVGCWQLSKFTYNLKNIDNESKWVTEKNGSLLVLRDDGKFMKWFGDYGDNGNFELRDDSLFLNLKRGDGSTKYKLDSLTSFEMIISNKDEFVPILKYRRLSKEVYDIWKVKFK